MKLMRVEVKDRVAHHAVRNEIDVTTFNGPPSFIIGPMRMTEERYHFLEVEVRDPVGMYEVPLCPSPPPIYSIEAVRMLKLYVQTQEDISPQGLLALLEMYRTGSVACILADEEDP